jgi:hypothetical protein
MSKSWARPCHEQLGLLDGIKVPRVAQHRVEAVGVVLDGGGELEPSQFRQTRAANCWPELEVA